MILVLLVFLIFLVFQGHHVLLTSQLVPLVQLPLVIQDNFRLPVNLAVREYLVLLIVHSLPGDLAVLEYLVLLIVLSVPKGLRGLGDLGDQGRSLLAVVDAFRAILGCSKWQAAIKSRK